MLKLKLLAIATVVSLSTLMVGCSGGGRLTINGEGASFPEPLYQKWFKAFSEKTDGVTVEYTAIGSGGGVNKFIEETVDFAASDAAMTDEEIKKVERGTLMLPVTAGSVVLAYHIDGYDGELKLKQSQYADIFLGNLTNWNEVDSSLPDKKITVVTRSDSSGTTYVFTNHLNAISDDWKKDNGGPGVGKSVQWPKKENFLAGAKNAGVTQVINDTDGAIGYIEYGYARNNDLKMAHLENKAGNIVPPTPENATASLDSIKLPENLRAFEPNPPGDNSYPIVTYTWLLVYKKYDDEKKKKVIKDLVEYCLTEGQKVSEEAGYIQLPESVVKKCQAALKKIE